MSGELPRSTVEEAANLITNQAKEIQTMPKFRLTFEVIETNECTIDIEAESPEAAKKHGRKIT
jgi:hypothetical protein